MVLSLSGSLESAILSVLWDLEEKGKTTNSVKDVHDSLNMISEEKKAYTTVKTVMDRLYDKKALTRIKHGNKFYYKTLYSNSEVVKKSLNELAERYCGGDLNKLISYADSRSGELVGV